MERQNQASSGEPLLDVEEDNNCIILVACKDECSCMQLEDCITNSPQKVFLLFLVNKRNLYLYGILVLF